MTPAEKPKRRAGVLFTCPECSRLWRDDLDHAERHREPCPDCRGELRLVGRGEQIVQFAKWFRCANCAGLFMWRRRELVPTKPRSGFEEFA